MATLRQIYDQDYVSNLVITQPFTKSAFWTSGAVQSSGKIQTLLASGQQGLELPYVTPIDNNVEPFYSNTIFTDETVPEGIGANKMKALVAYLNKSWYEASLEHLINGQHSPLQLIGNYVNSYWQTNLEHRLIATLSGIRSFDYKNGKKITTDKSTKAFSVHDLVEAEGTMDFARRGQGVLVVHPSIATQMRLAKLLIPFTDPADLKPVETYNGYRVVESKIGTVVKIGSVDKFASYILGSGAFIGESVKGEDDMELSRFAHKANGGGVTTITSRLNVLVQPQGWDFVADRDTLRGGTKNEALSANWEDLQFDENWALAKDVNIERDVQIRILLNATA